MAMKTICLYCFDAFEDHRGHVRECPERTHDIEVVSPEGEVVHTLPAPKTAGRHTLPALIDELRFTQEEIDQAGYEDIDDRPPKCPVCEDHPVWDGSRWVLCEDHPEVPTRVDDPAARVTRWVIEDELKVAQQAGVDFADIGTAPVADRITERLAAMDDFCVRCGHGLSQPEEDGMCAACDLLLQQGQA